MSMFDVGLLLLRVAIGLTVAAHGSQKLFGWFGGPGRQGFGGALESMGFRRAGPLVWLAGLAELVGGLLFAVGLVTPFAAAAIIGMMLAASVLVHADNGFFASEGGYELPFVIATVAVAVAIAGPGTFALDAVAGLPFGEPTWAWVAIGLGVVAALAVIGLQRLGQREAPERARTA